LVGTSSGANVAAAMRVAKELGPGSTVVTVLVDSGAKYFSTRLFDQAVANAVQATVELIPLDELD
jgi:hypothetical protein